MTPTTEAAPVRPSGPIPRMGFADSIRTLLASGGGRVDMLGTMRRLYDKHGPVVLQSRGPMHFVNLFGPDANRFVLLDKDQIFSARKPWMQIMGRIFPNGLLLRDGEEHRRHRRVMQEAFNRPVLKEYLDRMNPMIAQGVAGWSGAEGMKAFRAFKELTLAMAVSIFVGAEPDSRTREMNKAFEHMVAASMSRVRLPIPGLEFQRGLAGRKFMVDFFKRMIGGKRADASPDMFSRLCHARVEGDQPFDDQEIIDHMVFLMMAAHDTTTSTLTSMTFELGRRPEWQERIREESRALGKDRPDFEDLDKLTSMTLFMRETLRRYPPLPVIPRTATRKFEFGGYTIPAGVMVVVSPIHTHHMPEWWAEPFKFDPERFAPGRAEQDRHTHAWIPFGGGPHLCLGKAFAETQIRAIMHQMILRHRWSVPEGYEMPVQQAPISKPRDGLPISITSLN